MVHYRIWESSLQEENTLVFNKHFYSPHINPGVELRTTLVCHLLRFGRCQKYGSVGGEDDERRVCDESHQEPNEGEWPSSSGASSLLTSDLSGCSGRTPWKSETIFNV